MGKVKIRKFPKCLIDYRTNFQYQICFKLIVSIFFIMQILNLRLFETGPNCTNQILSQPKSILLLLLARRLSLSLSFYLLTFSVCYLTCPIIPSFFNVFRKPKPRNIFCQRDLVRSSFSCRFIFPYCSEKE